MKINLQPEALQAIGAGIEREDGIADLEALGVATRTISQLEREGILTLAQLMAISLGDLAMFPNIGLTAINSILKALNNYHKLADHVEI